MIQFNNILNGFKTIEFRDIEACVSRELSWYKSEQAS
jgi:hypothetical protein